MLDDADDGRPARDAPQLDPLYRNYVKACQRLGVDPMSRERFDELGTDFFAVLAGRRLPPTRH